MKGEGLRLCKWFLVHAMGGVGDKSEGACMGNGAVRGGRIGRRFGPRKERTEGEEGV